MLDYLEIRSDGRYSKSITFTDFNEKTDLFKSLQRTGNFSFEADIEGSIWGIYGVSADNNGNYNYNSDSEFDEINLIIIDLPREKEGSLEKGIAIIIFTLAEILGWEVYDPEEEIILKKEHYSFL